MTPIAKSNPPANFQNKVRQPGLRFLSNHPGTKPRGSYGYWTRVHPELRTAFESRCAYSALWISMRGVVDHYISLDEDAANGYQRAYDWDNYRYASQDANGHKSSCRSCDILDPFEVQDGWFEVAIPSLEVQLTGSCPAQFRQRAANTIDRLKLNVDPVFVELRREFYEMYLRGVPIVELDKKAPLIAKAIRAHNIQPIPPP